MCGACQKGMAGWGRKDVNVTETLKKQHVAKNHIICFLLSEKIVIFVVENR